MSTPFIHRIRLQGPWDVIPPNGDPADPPQQVTIPATWRELFSDKSGRGIFFRRFNCPTGLESSDRLLIRLPNGCGEVLAVQINDQEVTAEPDDPLLFEITAQIEPFNVLSVSVQYDPHAEPSGRGGLWQPVLLEIHGEGSGFRRGGEEVKQ